MKKKKLTKEQFFKKLIFEGVKKVLKENADKIDLNGVIYHILFQKIDGEKLSEIVYTKDIFAKSEEDARNHFEQLYPKTRKIIKISKSLIENQPAPTTKPAPVITPQREMSPNPIKIPKPGTFPKPNPKAKKKFATKITAENLLREWLKTVRLEEEKTRMKRLMNEAPPMDIEPGEHEPHPLIKTGIEGQSETPFGGIELFSKQRLDQSTIEKIGSEEFNAIVRSLGEVGKMTEKEMSNFFVMIVTYEMRHRRMLENLAKEIVQRKFGLSDEVMQMIDAKLKNPGEIEPPEDNDNPQDEVESQFTPEELEVIKKHVDKRIVSNTLMMGAGYRAHKIFGELKNSLDGIDERLYPLYSKIMPNIEIFMWKMPVEKTFGTKMMFGKSEIKQDENGVKAEATAIIFPVLLHEVAKAAVEILFLQHLADVQEKHGESVAKEVVKKADSFYDEHWLKLIGPRFWKYLHDALTFVVQEEGEDYTIIAYVLNKMASMEPEEFMELMDETIHDGPRAIEKIKQILRQVRDEIEAYENQGAEVPEPENMFPPEHEDEIAQLLAQNQQDLLTRTPEEEKGQAPTKNISDMNIDELNIELEKALGYENYERAALVRNEINRR